MHISTFVPGTKKKQRLFWLLNLSMASGVVFLATFLALIACASSEETEPPTRAASPTPSCSIDDKQGCDASLSEPQSSRYKPSPDVLLEWLVHPMPVTTFIKDFWEKKPLLLQRHSASYYASVDFILDEVRE